MIQTWWMAFWGDVFGALMAVVVFAFGTLIVAGVLAYMVVGKDESASLNVPVTPKRSPMWHKLHCDASLSCGDSDCYTNRRG